MAKTQEEKRDYGLAYYWENRETINRRRGLPALCRAAVRHGQQVWRDERDPQLLETAFRRVLKRQSRREQNDWADSLRKRFIAALKRPTGSRVVEEMAGASWAFVRVHLETMFQSGMTWSNHGSGKDCWNVDHIRPMVSFDLQDLAEQQLCFHWSNLQPLWHEDNARKADKLVCIA